MTHGMRKRKERVKERTTEVSSDGADDSGIQEEEHTGRKQMSLTLDI